MKVGIVIPDGTGIRNYLYSNLVEELHKKQCTLVLYHSVSNEAIEEIHKKHRKEFEVIQLPAYSETLLQKFYRETICFARLNHNAKKVENPTILAHWTPRKRTLKTKLFYSAVEFIGAIIAKDYKKILGFESRYDKSIAKSSSVHKSILKETKPAILFSTHQRSMNAVPLIKAAKILGVKSVGAIFSWDNLPKARITVRTDSYVVWSRHMKSEMNTFYPEVNNDNIEITGTPQFEFYHREELQLTKEEFCNKFELALNKKTLCFSGDDEFTSPFDPKFLEDIVKVIDQKKLDVQVILRRAPVDLSGRFDYLIEKYPQIIKPIAPLWVTASNDTSQWQTIFPSFDDVKLLINTVKHSDVVINLGSTMALDFAMYSKPAIYLNYNPVQSNDWNVEKIYNFQHFRSIDNLTPVVWLNDKNDIAQVIESALINTKALDNLEWLDKIAEHRKDSSKNIAKYIVSCI